MFSTVFFIIAEVNDMLAMTAISFNTTLVDVIICTKRSFSLHFSNNLAYICHLREYCNRVLYHVVSRLYSAKYLPHLPCYY